MHERTEQGPGKYPCEEIRAYSHRDELGPFLHFGSEERLVNVIGDYVDDQRQGYACQKRIRGSVKSEKTTQQGCEKAEPYSAPIDDLLRLQSSISQFPLDSWSCSRIMALTLLKALLPPKRHGQNEVSIRYQLIRPNLK